MKEQVRCPYCHEYVTVDNRRWPLGDHSARLHMKRCPFSPIKVRPPDRRIKEPKLPGEAPDA